MFDLKSFQTGATSEAGSTVVIPIPAGEYPAIIDGVELTQGEKEGRHWLACDIAYLLQAPEVSKQIGREKLAVRQRLFLDTKDGKLDMSQGKNISLNRLREAVGQNKPGQSWGFDSLKGQMVKVKTKLVEGRNGQFADVDSVGKM